MTASAQAKQSEQQAQQAQALATLQAQQSAQAQSASANWAENLAMQADANQMVMTHVTQSQANKNYWAAFVIWQKQVADAMARIREEELARKRAEEEKRAKPPQQPKPSKSQLLALLIGITVLFAVLSLIPPSPPKQPDGQPVHPKTGELVNQNIGDGCTGVMTICNYGGGGGGGGGGIIILFDLFYKAATNFVSGSLSILTQFVKQVAVQSVMDAIQDTIVDEILEQSEDEDEDEGQYIYRVVDPSRLDARAVALRRPIDYLTGFSFYRNTANIPPEQQGVYLRYRVDTLRNYGYNIEDDGGLAVFIIQGISLDDIRELLDDDALDTANRLLNGTFPLGHVRVYHNNRDYWKQWYQDENQAKQSGNVSNQTLFFLSLGEFWVER